MKVCPQCGFVDPPWWRQRHAHGLFQEICNLDDFQEHYPDLAARINGAATKTRDGAYVYWVVRTSVGKRFGGGLVVRQPIEEYKAYGTRVAAEPPSHRKA